MKNAPKFTVAPVSITGHSLLQWEEPGARFPRSVQMETEIAQRLAKAANSHAVLVETLRRLAVQVESAEEGFAECGQPLSSNCVEMIEARKLLGELGA